jgi:hypothetical protein
MLGSPTRIGELNREALSQHCQHVDGAGQAERDAASRPDAALPRHGTLGDPDLAQPGPSGPVERDSAPRSGPATGRPRPTRTNLPRIPAGTRHGPHPSWRHSPVRSGGPPSRRNRVEDRNQRSVRRCARRDDWIEPQPCGDGPGCPCGDGPPQDSSRWELSQRTSTAINRLLARALFR